MNQVHANHENQQIEDMGAVDGQIADLSPEKGKCRDTQTEKSKGFETAVKGFDKAARWSGSSRGFGFAIKRNQGKRADNQCEQQGIFDDVRAQIRVGKDAAELIAHEKEQQQDNKGQGFEQDLSKGWCKKFTR